MYFTFCSLLLDSTNKTLEVEHNKKKTLSGNRTILLQRDIVSRYVQAFKKFH